MSDAKPIREFVAEFLELAEEPVGLCEDCEAWSDLGRKCSKCYAAWKRLIWQDVPRAHRELIAAFHDVTDHGEKRGIAEHALTDSGAPLSRDAAELLARVKACLDGPFGPSMRGLLVAIRSRSARGGSGE